MNSSLHFYWFHQKNTPLFILEQASLHTPNFSHMARPQVQCGT